MAKARVIEIFHTSRLWYAAKFYPVPQYWQTYLQQIVTDYMNFPAKTATISKRELHKLRKHGGAKLINIQKKSKASKIKWLMELIIEPG